MDRTFFLFLISSLVACGRSPQVGENATTTTDRSGQVQELFDRYADLKKEASPTHATNLGFEGHEGHWGDGSLASMQRRVNTIEELLQATTSLDADAIEAGGRVYHGLMVQDMQNALLQWQNGSHLLAISEQFGVHQNIPYVVSDHPVNNKKDVEALIRLLSTTDKPINDAIEQLQQGIDTGVTQPRAAVKGVPDQIAKVLDLPAEETPFYKPFKEIGHLNANDQMAYRQQAKEAIEQVVKPAYQKLLGFVNDRYLPACRESVGLFEVPDGAARYAARIKHYTTTDLTAQEIHDIGLAEVKRILGEMEGIKNNVGFQGDLNAFNEFLRTDPQFFYTEHEDLLSGYQVICKKIDPRLVKLFGHLPRLPYGVVPVPEYLEKYYTTARYSGGSMENAKPGEYLANTYALNTRPKWEMEALSLHEAVPGHHLQISLEKEISDQPDFKKFLHYTVYVEGWGLYAESLGEELGLYQDPYSKYGQLTYEMWRAIRLVVDTGIHAFGWTREEAIAYFKANSPKSENDITVEVDRYIGWPGQALAYKIGELKIQEIKQSAQEQLGDHFDIRAFHDKLLSKGSLPINVLETIMGEWVAERNEAVAQR